MSHSIYPMHIILTAKAYEGKKYKYSEQPFYRPWDKKIQAKLGGRKGEGVYYKTTFSKTTGLIGWIILGGYKQYKEKVFPQSKNFLEASGKMLKSMNVKTTDSEAVIGFADPEESRKAFYLNVSGAGRSRRLWKFMGITKEQEKSLVDALAEDYKVVALEKLAKVSHLSP